MTSRRVAPAASLDIAKIIGKVIAFGTAVTNEELYERFARAGIESIAEADALVMVRRGARLQSAYNSMMDEAGARPDLEAVVLLHQDLRVEDLAFNAKVRGALSDPDVALVGALGARGLRGSFLHDAQIVGEVRAQFGDAVMPLRAIVPTGYCDVEAIDGALLILSAWAARNLKFDPLLERDFHGYDLDLSFQARARGRRVVVTDVRAVHDGTGTVGPRRGSLIRALLGLEDKWQPWLASAPRVRTNMPELERVRAEIEGHVRREIRAKRPPLGAAGPPPPVSYHEKRSNRQRWVARWEQHGLDSYAGVPLVKLPEDLRVYEHLIWLSRADTVIELGTFFGGSALWLRDRLQTIGRYWGAPPPRVLSIDRRIDRAREYVAHVDPHYAQTIALLAGDVLDPELPAMVDRLLRPGARCLVLEDSAHFYDTTMAVLRGFARFVPESGFLVVEDTHCDVEELRVEEEPRGALLAVLDWLKTPQGGEFTVRHDLELYGFTGHPGGFLQRTHRSRNG